MSKNILDNLRKPDIDIMSTHRYYSVTLWVDEGIQRGNNGLELISDVQMSRILNTLANDKNYPHRQVVLDFITEKALLG